MVDGAVKNYCIYYSKSCIKIFHELFTCKAIVLKLKYHTIHAYEYVLQINKILFPNKTYVCIYYTVIS